jgi:hypothetical protein
MMRQKSGTVNTAATSGIVSREKTADNPICSRNQWCGIIGSQDSWCAFRSPLARACPALQFYPSVACATVAEFFEVLRRYGALRGQEQAQRQGKSQKRS